MTNMKRGYTKDFDTGFEVLDSSHQPYLKFWILASALARVSSELTRLLIQAAAKAITAQQLHI
jgi:hypothetical protein